MPHPDKPVPAVPLHQPCSVSSTSREVIENKLLAALEDDNTVAILASKQDLVDMIFALEGYTCDPTRRARLRDLADGMRQLYKGAFPSPLNSPDQAPVSR